MGIWRANRPRPVTRTLTRDTGSSYLFYSWVNNFAFKCCKKNCFQKDHVTHGKSVMLQIQCAVYIFGHIQIVQHDNMHLRKLLTSPVWWLFYLKMFYNLLLLIWIQKVTSQNWMIDGRGTKAKFGWNTAAASSKKVRTQLFLLAAKGKYWVYSL
jgi:hypothetical protein